MARPYKTEEDRARWRANVSASLVGNQSRRGTGEFSSEYARTDPRYLLDWRYRQAYGLTLSEYDRMFAEQGGVCGLCGASPKKNRLAVDHDKLTGKVRGLLCLNCNLAIGRLEGGRREKTLEWMDRGKLTGEAGRREPNLAP